MRSHNPSDLPELEEDGWLIYVTRTKPHVNLTSIHNFN